MPLHRRSQRNEDARGVLAVAQIAGERGQAQQRLAGQTRPRWRRVIRQVAWTPDQRLGVAGSIEERSGWLTPEALDHRLDERAGEGEAARIASGFIEAEEG